MSFSSLYRSILIMFQASPRPRWAMTSTAATPESQFRSLWKIRSQLSPRICPSVSARSSTVSKQSRGKDSTSKTKIKVLYVILPGEIKSIVKIWVEFVSLFWSSRVAASLSYTSLHQTIDHYPADTNPDFGSILQICPPDCESILQ